MTIVRFEANDHDLTGFWGPISSSIDWCERNYVISQYIAEFWNSMSSFIIILFAFAGMWQSRQLEWKYWLFHLSIVFVGLGSICFHGTLTWMGQFGDELPMIWTMLIWWYILITLENDEGWMQIAIGLTTYGFLFSLLHCFYSFTTVFQVSCFFFAHHFLQIHSILLILVGLVFVFRYSSKYYSNHPVVAYLGYLYFVSMAGNR
jgi:hypothetical protein